MTEETTPTPLQFRNGIIEEAPLNTVQLRCKRTIGSVNTLFLTPEEHNYYGKVFAASPELLWALEQIKSLCGKTYPTNEAIFEIAKNAINKVGIIKTPE